MSFKRRLNRKPRALVKGIVAERQQAKLVIAAILETAEAWYGEPLPKALMELVLADVDGLISTNNVIPANALKELINTCVANFRARASESDSINHVEGGNR
jgi:hypothetical protein